MEDVTSLIQAVESFEEKENPWSDELERFIAHVARTGDILAPWEKVQIVFKNKLRLVMDEFYSTNPYKIGKVNANATNDDFDEMKKRLLQLAEEFDSPPFTIQRLCELLMEPKKNYTKCDKFMRGLEKNLMVVSSWNNVPRRLSESNDGMVNGVSVGPSNGFVVNDRLKPHWSSLPPSPVATTPPKIPGAPDFTDIATVAPKQQEITTEESKGQSEVSAQETVSSPNEDVTSTEEQTDEDSEKKSVSATIISSSPPKTINIKRKIDESADEPSTTAEKASSDPQIEESPTKKRKSDAPETPENSQGTTPQEEDQTKSEETADTKLDSTAQPEEYESHTDSTDVKRDSTEPENADSTESSQSESQTDVKMDTTDEGSSVDPPTGVKSEKDAQMDVD